MFVRSEEQRVDAPGVVVGSLVDGAPAGEVESLAQAVGPVAPVGFAEQIEGHQVKQLAQPGAVGERSDAVTDPAVDLTQGLLDRTGGVESERVAREGLGVGGLP